MNYLKYNDSKIHRAWFWATINGNVSHDNVGDEGNEQAVHIFHIDTIDVFCHDDMGSHYTSCGS